MLATIQAVISQICYSRARQEKTQNKLKYVPRQPEEMPVQCKSLQDVTDMTVSRGLHGSGRAWAGLGN